MRATIKLKLGVTFLVVILLSAISAAFALSGLGSLRDSVCERVRLAGPWPSDMKRARSTSDGKW